MARWLGADYRFEWTIANLKLRFSDSYLPRGVTPDLADLKVSPREGRSTSAPTVQNIELWISSFVRKGSRAVLHSRSAYGT